MFSFYQNESNVINTFSKIPVVFVIYIFIKLKYSVCCKNFDDDSPIETLCLNGCQVGNPNE